MADQYRASPWQNTNQACLRLHLRRLRLLLRRRAMCLRQQWRHDPREEFDRAVVSDAHADWLLRGEDTAEENRFYSEDPAGVRLGEEIASVEQEIHDRRETMGSQPAAIDVITQLFRLTPFERDVLILCLAPDMDPSFGPLYAYAQDDVTRKEPTPHLALALFNATNDDGPANRDCLAADGTLRRYRLIEMEDTAAPLGTRSLGLDERVGDYLRGVNRPDLRINDLVQPLPTPILASTQHDLVGRGIWAVNAHRERGVWPLLNLVGPPDSGQQEIAHAICESMSIRLYRLDLKRLPASPGDQQQLLALLERETVLLQLAYYIDATELDIPTERETTRFIDDMIARPGLFALVASRETWHTELDQVDLPMASPSAATQLDLWRKALDASKSSLNGGDMNQVVQQFHFGPRAIVRAVDAARGAAQIRARDVDAPLQQEDLWAACRQESQWQLDELAQRITPGYSWDDLVVPIAVRDQLQEIADQVKHRHLVYDSWGFGDASSRGRGISVMFSGPSGTGKTMAAEILAKELNLTLYRIDLAGVVSKYIGETEKNLRRLFDAAERSGAILFFDEADALFGKRTDVKDSHDRYANIEIDYLLQRMEAYQGLAILATNRRAAIDRAFLRRLRFVVEMNFPNADSRRRIWQKAFPPNTPTERLDYDRLSQLEIAGGNIRNVALNATFLAAADGGRVTMDQIMRASRREYAKIDKLETNAELGNH